MVSCTRAPIDVGKVQQSTLIYGVLDVSLPSCWTNQPRPKRRVLFPGKNYLNQLDTPSSAYVALPRTMKCVDVLKPSSI